MTLSKMEINKRLDVVWHDKIYKSIVQDVSEDSIAIATPLAAGLFLPLHKGDTFPVVYYKDEKEIYEFLGFVTGRKLEGNVQLVILEYPKVIKLIQRREFVRVEISHPIKYVKALLESELKHAESILNSNNGKSGTLVDLSGGGLRFKTTEKMELNHFVAIEIDLLDQKIRVHGKVVRVFVDDISNYVCGVSFIEVNERLRDKVIQLIFEIMRKQIQTS
jgi:c-di-GMP-binding flagellar brake protein YcgR